MNKTAFVGLIIVSTLCVSSPKHAWGHGQGLWGDFRADLWIGPHLNLHFGDHGVEFSLGVETSVWTEPGLGAGPKPLCLGADAGIEYNFSREIWVRYAELQAGVVLAGLSVGVVSDGDYGAGLQTSLWANIIGGAMVRYRKFWDTQYRDRSIGAYVKGPYMEALSTGLFRDTPFYTGGS